MIEILARQLAAKYAIPIEGQPLGELIQRIQIAEGNFPCYGTAKGFCDQISCAWRMSCVYRDAIRRRPLTEDGFRFSFAFPRRSQHLELDEARLSRKLKRLQDFGNAVPAEYGLAESEFEPREVAVASR